MKLFDILALSAIFSGLVCSCGLDDSEKAWGLTKVYMPQAAMLDGGLSNEYLVPFNNNAVTDNYEIDEETNTLKIYLGVYRSGLQELESFTVNVYSDPEASEAAAGSVSRGVPLPEEVYSIPQTVTVRDGEREQIFFLEVDLTALEESYPSYNRNKMVLVVGIDSPTKYELNEALARTTVVIDGASFLPVPPIVNGGDFGEGSEEYWSGEILAGPIELGTNSGIADGVLFFDYGTGAEGGESYWYTEVELEAGMQYKFSCDFVSTGENINASSGARFYILLRQTDPHEGFNYNDGKNTFDIYVDAWNGLVNPISGVLPGAGGWQDNIDPATGIFTADFTGTGYLIFYAVGWSSPVGHITIDNVEITLI